MTRSKSYGGTNQPGIYEVGFGKPPRATQFKKGQSGNPNGRPKVRHDLGAVFCKALDDEVRITIAGITRRVTKAQAILAVLVNRALTGDAATLRTLTKLAAKVGELKAMHDRGMAGAIVRLSHEEWEESERHRERLSQTSAVNKKPTPHRPL